MKISIILPFYRKLSGFKFAAPRSPLLRHKDVEIVIPIDDPEGEDELVKFVQREKLKARIIVNDRPHDWRPPCKAINVGLRHAHGEWVIIQSPETILCSAPRMVFQHVPFADKKVFITGRLYHGSRTEHPFRRDAMWFRRRSFTPGYGFIMVPRHVVEAINGMDERRTGYGGDDDDIRLRLKQIGFQCYVDGRINVVHIRHGSEHRPPRIDFEPYGHDIVIPNQDEWGKDFSRISYDYTR
jgi:hypothetical protein